MRSAAYGAQQRCKGSGASSSTQQQKLTDRLTD